MFSVILVAENRQQQGQGDPNSQPQDESDQGNLGDAPAGFNYLPHPVYTDCRQPEQDGIRDPTPEWESAFIHKS